MNFSGADFMPQIGRVSTDGVMIDMIGIEVGAMGVEGNSKDEGDRADDGKLIEGDMDVPMDKLDGAEMMGDDAADEDSIANYRCKEHSGPSRWAPGARSGLSEGRGQRQPNNQHPSDCDNVRRGPPKLR